MAINKVKVNGEQYELAGSTGGGSGRGMVKHILIANIENKEFTSVDGSFTDVIEDSANAANHVLLLKQENDGTLLGYTAVNLLYIFNLDPWGIGNGCEKTITFCNYDGESAISLGLNSNGNVVGYYFGLS